MSWVLAVGLLLMTACTKNGKQEDAASTTPPDKAKTLASSKTKNAEDPRTQENLESIARQLHPEQPMMIDAATRLDSVSAGTNGRTLRFRYTVLDNKVAAEVTKDAGPFERGVQDRMCEGLGTSRVLQDGFELSMEYVDRTGRRVAHFYVDKSKCPDAMPT